MIRVNNIHLSLDYDDKSVRKAVARQLRIEEKFIKSCKIFRRSVDARKKDNIYFLTTVDADRKSTRLNSSHMSESRMPSSA